MTTPHKEIASGLKFPEGPVAMPDGSVILVEIARETLTRVMPDGKQHIIAKLGGGPNGAAMGPNGKIYVCNNGGFNWIERPDGRLFPGTQPAHYKTGSIQVVDPESGKFETMYDSCDGRKLNGPNDLVFAADGRLLFTDPGTYNPTSPDPSYIYAIEPNGSVRLAVGFERPTFPNGLAVEADGSIVWAESYTGHVCRRRPDGSREDLGRLPGDNPTPDGMKIGADGRLYVTDIFASGIHILRPDGTAEAFLACGKATTNCVFDGETLWVTAAGVLADGTDPSFGGTLWRLRVPGGGAPTHCGRIAAAARA